MLSTKILETNIIRGIYDDIIACKGYQHIEESWTRYIKQYLAKVNLEKTKKMLYRVIDYHYLYNNIDVWEVYQKHSEDSIMQCIIEILDDMGIDKDSFFEQYKYHLPDLPFV